MGHFSVYNELKLRVTISPSLKSWKKTKTEPLCSIRTSYSFHSRVTCDMSYYLKVSEGQEVKVTSQSELDLFVNFTTKQ